jgi:hypothetical protein
MITVISVFNNEDILEERLLKSLKTQNKEYELILIDNSDGKFKSAAAALNYGAENATKDYLMFVHQDVDLIEESCLRNIEGVLDSMKYLGVAGVAGYAKTKGKPVMMSNIQDGYPPEDVGLNIDGPVEVQTVDECLFIVPRSQFKELKFDEETCPDWHLYGTDYCLSTKKLGKQVYVIPTNIYHASRTGSFSETYYSTLNNIVDKHGREYETIDTSCGVWHTNKFRLGINIMEDRILRKLNLR